ncbi:uncharacterized membrane protein YhaH (DUF805 family) [Rhodococcus sp. PvR044]|uniref:DUF6790 family protein n=1 Tax=unclassified Rhodococcus (in: high G+C Gram-positive bacteria) TaxID=192944 RepID=UPI001AE17DE3|nr:DUF6790 family protein [Rhodococcus sp. PvR099]MBP1160057.1 uncharacterized membrane protein YhaH (DUF805 family) [Rhodococcus sp. PvR099]
MTTVIAVALALIVAAIQVRRHRTDTRPAAVIDTYLVWWLVLAIGLSSVVGAAFHVFDGPAIAEMIGYTRGDGGFQFENAMGDLAIGVTGVLCFWFRGYFWLALLTVTTIQYFGDAAGHVYFWIAEDNTKSGNIGAPLWFDIILPVVGFTLYALSYRRGGDARPVGART